MTELRLVFDCSPDDVPSLEIEPKGYTIEVMPPRERPDGRSEIVLRFGDGGVNVICADEEGR